MPRSSSPEDRFRCLCGLLHVVTGTELFLVFYVILSIFSMLFGMRSTLTWLIVPICVTALGIYGISTKKHKYLYPFLIITVVQQFVCVLMASIILFFSILNFETMRQIIGHSLDLHGVPSKETCIIIMGATISVCVLLSFIYIWQSVVIYSCLQYYEERYEELDERRIIHDIESTSY